MSNSPEEKDFFPEVEVTDKDILEAMKDIPGYLDITPKDFKELYQVAYRHALSRITRSLKAKDIMTSKVFSAERETPLKEVALLMAQNKISGVPVVNENGSAAGIISEKDFLSNMGAKDPKTFMGVVAECLKDKGCVVVSIRAKKAGDIMTSPAITVSEDTSVMEIANIFTEKNINRVPVIDRRSSVTGIVSREDIVRASLIKNK